MKNNFITKIIGATLAFAMMIGGAVGIFASREAKMVDATYGAPETLSCPAGTVSNNQMSFSTTSFNIVHAKGTGSNFASYSPWRVYTNNTITISAKNGTTKIGKVEFVHSGTNYGNIQCTNPTGGTVSMASSSGGTSSWTIADANAIASVAFKNGASSQARFTSIKIYPVSEGAPSLADPNPQYNSFNKTVSWTVDEHATKYQVKIDEGDYSDINTATYDASGLTQGVEHTVYIKAVGDEVNYSSAEGSVSFVPFDGKMFAQCTSESDLEADATYVITSTISQNQVYAMSTVDNANNRRTTQLPVVDSRIASTYETLTLTLGGTSGAWTFHTDNYLGDDGYLAPAAGSDNHLRVISETDTCGISFTSGKANIVFSSNSDGRNTIRFNNSANPKLFACYSSGQNDILLWKEYKELDHLDVTGALEKTSYYDSETFSSAGLTISAVYNNSSSRVLAANEVDWEPLTAGMTQIRGSYTENNITKYTQYFSITVAADSLSSVTLSGTMGANYYLDSEWDPGTLAVTANYASNTHVTVTNDATIAYYSDSAMQNEVATPADLGVGQNQTVYVKATYNAVSNTTGYAQTVTVSVEPGTTANNPLTADNAVEKGLALAAVGNETEKQYYIQGVVIQVIENDLGGTHNNATFLLQEANQTAEFKAYRIAPEGEFNNYDELVEGAEVLIKCKIKKFSTTSIQNGSVGALLSISYTAPEATGVTLNKTSLNLEVNDTFQLSASLQPVGAQGNVAWSSSNASVASVSDAGLVTAESKGSAIITAQVSENVYAECNVVVAEPSRSTAREIVVDLTSGASVNDTSFSLTIQAESKTGYYQDGSGTDRYIAAKATTPMFVCEPASIVLKAILGGGSVKDPLSNNVKACLVDTNGNNIESTVTDVTSAITATTGAEYSVELPYSADAYGFKIMHTKETQYNVRYYSFSLSYKYADTFAVLSGNETNEGVNQVKMTFGATVSVATWNSLQTAYGTITDYGVMMFKTTSALSSDTPVQDRFKVNGALANFHKGSGEISPDADIYKFSAYVSFSDNTKYGTTVCAAPYIVANGVYYFLGEVQYSVNTLAQYHLQNGGSNLSTEALNVLAGN